MSKKLLQEIVGQQYFAVLSTAENGQPYCNLVAFAVTDDLKHLIFVTPRNTAKFKNIIDNPGVALLVDNRGNNPADIEKATAITVIGDAHEAIENESLYRSIYLARHPNLSRFLDDNALIVVSITSFIVAGFASTQRLISGSD